MTEQRDLEQQELGQDELVEAIAAQRHQLADRLADLSAAQWDEWSLCDGWRVREVVAHITMPFRYSAFRFVRELAGSRGNFNRMADRCAKRDAQAPVGELLAGLRDNERNPWKPPGGGLAGALTHDVVHGQDITLPLGLAYDVPAAVTGAVLATVTAAPSQKHFGVDLTGVQLQATDLDWSLGTGAPVRGAARHLLMVACGRRLPVGYLGGPAAPRFTDA